MNSAAKKNVSNVFFFSKVFFFTSYFKNSQYRPKLPPARYGEVRGWFWGVFWVILGVPEG